MSVLYITEQGARISKTGDRIIVEKDGKELLEIECHKLQSILIFGNVQITTQAMRKLFEHSIEAAFLTMHGELLGQLTPVTPKNVALRVNQVRRFDDPEFTLDVARSIVSAKISNAVVLIQEFQRNHGEVDVKGPIESLRGSTDSVAAATSREGLLGIEGNAGSVYWQAFRLMCRGDMQFTQRVKRPPTDPVNALLSFGYTLVFARIQSLLDAVGLDPYIGFFHQPHYGRPSLAADLLEEFRSPLVDRFTLSLVNKRILSPGDFEPHEESGGVRLTKEGLKKYFPGFEQYFGKKLSGFDDPQMDFYALIRRQVERLARCIDIREPYNPFRMALT